MGGGAGRLADWFLSAKFGAGFGSDLFLGFEGVSPNNLKAPEGALGGYCAFAFK